MRTSIRLAALALCLATISGPAAAATAGDTTALQFHGFRAGARLDELEARLRLLQEGKLRCERAKADRQVTECRGRFSDPELGGVVDLWISAIDSVAGIITISADVDSNLLDRWREGIVASYGRVGARAQGSQWMMQWVRRGRMLRLTWRMERKGRTVSVSLVDGRVLDSWGRSRSRTRLSLHDSIAG
jgi:hypothetical protein